MKRFFKTFLALCLISCSIACFSFAKTVNAEEVIEWGGYYEQQYDLTGETPVAGGMLTLTETDIPSGKMNKVVVIDADGTEHSLAKNFVVDSTLNTAYFYGLEQYREYFKLGNEYVVKFSGNNGIGFRAKFTYVTKAIRTVEDVKVLDISTKDVHLDGYYVLENDLVIPSGQENKHKGLSSGYSYTGFSGYFDGQGHSITFDSTGPNGFFGKLVSYKEDKDGNVVIHNKLLDTDNDGRTTLHVLRVRTPDGQFVERDGTTTLDDENNCLNWNACKGPTIVNVGFVDCKVLQSSVICGNTNLVFSGKALLKDIYIRTSSDSTSPFGAFMTQASIWAMVENVFIDCPDQHIENLEHFTWGRVGAMYSNDSNKDHNSRDQYHKNVYVVGELPLVYMRPGAATRPGQGNWFTIYGENEKDEPDWENGVYVYKNVFKYNTAYELQKASHDYSAFNSKYWDTSLGIPIWKSAGDRLFDVYLQTEQYVYNNTVTLYVGETDTVGFDFGYGNMPIDCDSLNIEITRGQEFVNLTGKTLQAIYTPEDTTSVVKITVSAVYNSINFEKEFTVLVNNPAPSQQPETPNENEGTTPPDSPQDDENKGGCASVTTDFGGFTGGMGAMMLFGAFVLIKRKKLSR